MHYMAKCDGSCASYNSSNAEWFKISEQGQKPGGSTWYQADLSTAFIRLPKMATLTYFLVTGSPATVTIPATLAPGDYLLRSELIALQLAVTEGGAEFYPACIQLSVGGSQTSQPTSSEEVTLPGGYQDTNPGILTPDVSLLLDGFFSHVVDDSSRFITLGSATNSRARLSFRSPLVILPLGPQVDRAHHHLPLRLPLRLLPRPARPLLRRPLRLGMLEATRLQLPPRVTPPPPLREGQARACASVPSPNHALAWIGSGCTDAVTAPRTNRDTPPRRALSFS